MQLVPLEIQVRMPQHHRLPNGVNQVRLVQPVQPVQLVFLVLLETEVCQDLQEIKE